MDKPTNLVWNAHSKHPAFLLSCSKDIHQDLSEKVDTHERAWKRKPLRCFYTRSSKASCIKTRDQKFWNRVGHHNRTCERYIGRRGRMSQCLFGGTIRDSSTSHGRMKVDMPIRGFMASSWRVIHTVQSNCYHVIANVWVFWKYQNLSSVNWTLFIFLIYRKHLKTVCCHDFFNFFCFFQLTWFVIEIDRFNVLRTDRKLVSLNRLTPKSTF